MDSTEAERSTPGADGEDPGRGPSSTWTPGWRPAGALAGGPQRYRERVAKLLKPDGAEGDPGVEDRELDVVEIELQASDLRLVACQERQESMRRCTEGTGAKRACKEEGRWLVQLFAGRELLRVLERGHQRHLIEGRRVRTATPDEEADTRKKSVEPREHQPAANGDRCNGCRPASRSARARS